MSPHVTHLIRFCLPKASFGALVWALLLVANPALADQRASNVAHVKTDTYGHFYAKSVPSEYFGSAGQTRVYRVTETEDVLLHTYPWFAYNIHLRGFRGQDVAYVIRMGPWAGSLETSADHLAFTIYKGAELIKHVSTLGLSKRGARPSKSVSYDPMAEASPDFRRIWGNKLVFEVTTHGQERLAFDVDTGELVTAEEEKLGKQLYDAQSTIYRIKSKWHRQYKDKVPNIKEHKITEHELRQMEPDSFPELPPGYRYVPDSIWQPVKLSGPE